MRMINVTEEDIANGVQRHAMFCPIAIALRRELGKLKTPTVSYTFIYLSFDENGHPDWRATPPEIVTWLRAYDNGEEVQPFAFDLDMLVKQTPGDLARQEYK